VQSLNRLASASLLVDSDLIEDTIDWVEEVLKPEWVDPNLQRRLVAATGVMHRRDAFLARYSIDNAKLQIIVTRFLIHLVISPCWDFGPVDPVVCANTFLNVQLDPEILWMGGPWSTLPVDGFTFGYQRLPLRRDWRDTLDYLSDGRAVKFTMAKIAQQPPDSKPSKTGRGPTEQAESQWFESHAEMRRYIDEFSRST
jgi:hypothetical protein